MARCATTAPTASMAPTAPWAAPLAAMVVPGGTLVVSGFMHYERDGVEAALDAFDVVSRTHEDEWCADVLRRR